MAITYCRAERLSGRKSVYYHMQRCGSFAAFAGRFDSIRMFLYSRSVRRLPMARYTHERKCCICDCGRVRHFRRAYSSISFIRRWRRAAWRRYHQQSGGGWWQAQRGPTLEDACNALKLPMMQPLLNALSQPMSEHHPDKLVPKVCRRRHLRRWRQSAGNSESV